MKSFFAISLFAAAIMLGEELQPETMRERLHAKVIGSLPPPALARVGEEPKIEIPPLLLKTSEVGGATQPAQEKTPNDGSVVVMAPFVYSEQRRDRTLEATIARQMDRPRFSPVVGGTLYSNGRLKVGSWWSPTEGWSVFKMSW